MSADFPIIFTCPLFCQKSSPFYPRGSSAAQCCGMKEEHFGFIAQGGGRRNAMGIVQAGYYGICFLWHFCTFCDGTQALAFKAMIRSHVQVVSLGMAWAKDEILDRTGINPQGKASQCLIRKHQRNTRLFGHPQLPGPT